MKIKFGTDDDLPLNKQLKLHILTIVVRSVFQADGKFYPQIYLNECCMSYKNATVPKNRYFRRN